MQRLEVSGAVRLIYRSLGVKRLNVRPMYIQFVSQTYRNYVYRDNALLSTAFQQKTAFTGVSNSALTIFGKHCLSCNLKVPPSLLITFMTSKFQLFLQVATTDGNI